MITENMSWKEVEKEILSDIWGNWIYLRALKKTEHSMKAYRKAAYSTDGFRAFKAIVIESERKNTYYFIPYTNGKHSFKKEGILFVVCTYFHTKQGLCAAMVINNGLGIDIFLPHVFKRYAERSDHSGLIDEIGLINYGLHYMVRNRAIDYETVPSKKYGDNAICGHFDNGLIFGNREDGICVFKTFVSTDMLYEPQIEIKNATKEKLDYYKKIELENYLRMCRFFKPCA